MKKSSYGLIASFASVLLAIYFFYLPPNYFLNSFTPGPTIYGLKTNIILESYPLENHLGETVYWKDYSNKPLYIGIGFTKCTFSCPLLMSFFQQLLLKMDNSAQFALLTIDPKFDTPQQLSSYLASFHQDFIGLRINSQSHFKKINQQLKQKVSSSTSLEEHNNYVYLIHPKYKGLIIYQKPDLQQIVDDLTSLSQQVVEL
ncbi:MAG: SCO family protein [Pseudomonadota bacterium]